MSSHRHDWVVVRQDRFSDLVVRVFLCLGCWKRRAEATPRGAR